MYSNHVGYLKAAHSLQWTGAEEFADASMRDWTVDGKENRAGETKSSKGLLTWATVEGAGHLVRSFRSNSTFTFTLTPFDSNRSRTISQ